MLLWFIHQYNGVQSTGHNNIFPLSWKSTLSESFICGPRKKFLPDFPARFLFALKEKVLFTICFTKTNEEHNPIFSCQFHSSLTKQSNMVSRHTSLRPDLNAHDHCH